jgi:hypothetical protein
LIETTKSWRLWVDLSHETEVGCSATLSSRPERSAAERPAVFL